VSGIRAAGLAAELAAARLLLESGGVGFRYALADLALSPQLETALALTVREAVTNIQRHAQARQAEVGVSIDAGHVHLWIVDDGRGSTIVPGNGLNGMRERVEALGGSLRIESPGGHGTRVEVRIALPTDELPEAAAQPAIAP
ncbi:MAG: sensor histidine kinase, partial [Xanthomonadales bacterium]|nr:sensor histidine kinase [Xanthomonadales bacterium]